MAMGRLLWPFDRAMKTDCLIIRMAYEGSIEFRDTFEMAGTESTAAAAEPSQLPALTPGAFRSMGKR